jgi:hypothetical protein
MSITDIINKYNNSDSIKNNINTLDTNIDELSNKEILNKGKTIEIMYMETSKLENKEYILFVGTSILTIIIVVATYKIAMK